MKSKKNKK